MRIGLLGATVVLADADLPVDAGGAKQRAVLAQLALEPNQPVSVDRLAEGIWGEAVPGRYRQNLQVYVSTLRRALEPARSPKTPSRIVGHREAYELVAAPQEIDVLRFLDATQDGLDAIQAGRPATAAARLEEALAEWRGPALADLADQPFADEWITVLDERRLAAVEAKHAANLARGQGAELVADLRQLVAAHPGRERLWEYLMLALYRGGRQEDALAAYQEARVRLVEDAGLDPGPDLALVAERILRQDPELVATPSSAAEGAVFPVPLTPLLGPARSVTEALGRLADGARLVVLTGPGGVGKTRSALAVAAGLAETGRTVRWIPLEELADVEHADQAVAQALGLADLEDPSPLAGRDDVLILDNTEQLAGLGARVQRLLETAPALQVLAAGRSPLGVRGEHLVPVEPLDVTDAVALFDERARGVDPAFDLAGARPAVVRIVAALDGLPLAIELAGARISLFTADQLADQLLHLPEPSEARGTRQGSVHDLVGWSVSLLGDPARDLFVRLCACPGGFDLEAAEVVGAGLGLGPAGVHEAVGALLRAALLRSTESLSGRRFSMLNTVRSVGEESLGPGERSATESALAALWLRRAGRTDLASEPDPAAIAAASSGLPTTLLVLSHLLERHRVEDAARVLLAQRRGLAVAGRDDVVLRWGLSILDAGLDGPLAPVVRVAAGGAAYNCYDDRAEGLLASVSELEPDDATWRAFGNNWLCVLHADAGRPAEAQLHAERALAAAGSSGRPPMLRRAHSAAGWAALKRGDFEAAAAHAKAQAPLVGNDPDRVLALLDRCLAELFQESTDAALRSAQQALRIAQRLGPSQHLADAYQFLSWALVQAGDPFAAVATVLSAMRLHRTRSDPGWLVTNAALVGLCGLQLDRADEGRELLGASNGLALELFAAPSALPEPLLAVAEREHAPVTWDPAGPPVLMSVDELVDRAIGLAESLTS